jgi:hypothetical protein
MVGLMSRRAALFLVSLFLSALASGGAGLTAEPGKRCFKTLAECPVLGCEEPGSAGALLNTIKRRVPKPGTAIRITFRDLMALQDQAGDLFEPKHAIPPDERDQLRGLELANGDKISEGDLVELVGFVIGLPDRPAPSGPESVNCRISGAENNDFHIPIAADPKDSEFEGIVIEMIPQGRDAGWTTKKLKRIAREERPVVVRGQLFYDNKHRVNDNPAEPLHGEPKRSSLWEIHPVTEFFVCMTASKKCNPKNLKTQQWVRLEKLKE